MKILFITHCLDMFGANRSLLELIVFLRNEYDVDPYVLIPVHGEMEKALIDENIRYKYVRYYPWACAAKFPLSHLKLIIASFLNFFAVRKLVKIFNSEKIDIIHTNSVIMNVGGKLAEKLDIPHVWHIREFDKEFYNLKYLRSDKVVVNFLNTYSDIIVVVSNKLKEKYDKLFAKYVVCPNLNKITVVYNGLVMYNAPHNRKQPEQFNIDETIIQICMIAMLHRQKGHQSALESIKIICNKYPKTKLVLNFIGSGDKVFEKELRSFVKRNKLDAYVRFWGYCDNVQNILSYMDIGLICSENEAFGRVTVEYMLNKIPVIASNSGANPEIVTDRETGYLYKLDSSIDLAEKLYGLMIDKEKCSEFGNAGYIQALNNFILDITAKKIFKLYNNCSQ